MIELEKLNEQAIKILDLAKYMDKVFGESESHLRIAIMAGVGDSYNAGYRNGQQSVWEYERETERLKNKALHMDKITPLVIANSLSISKANGKVAAIRYFKETTGLSLKDSKNFVEELIEKENQQ